MANESGADGYPSDDDAPVGPSADEEAAFLAENPAEAAAIRTARAAPGEDEKEPAGELPPLEDLVKRIPMPTRDLMDELFRARFVTVKRVPASALKS